MSLPTPANYLGLWYILQDSPATGAVPSNQIILRKKAGDNTLYLETDAGEEKISTGGGGGGVGNFTQVTVTGDAVDTLLVQSDAKTEILRVDTNDEQVIVQGELQVQGDITLTGTLSTIMSNVLQFDDSLLKLSVGQTTTDAYDQGWYAEYSPDGVAVEYRGCIYDRTDGYFKFSDGMTTEPDGLAAITASGSLAVANLQAATFTVDSIDCKSVDCESVANSAGGLTLQSFGADSGVQISADGKTVGINKVPTAGQALDINGGNVFINEGYLDIRRDINGDNFMGVGNPNTGTSSRSTLYVGAGTSLSRIGQLSNTYIGDVGAGNAYYRCDAGRLHLQSNSTANGLIIANSGLNFGFGEVYESTSGMISMRRDGTTNNTLLMIRKDAFGAELGILGVAGNSWAGTVAGDFTLRGTSGRKIYMGVQGTQPTVIDAGGNVGIRTANPQRTLHVLSDSGTNGVRIQTNSAASTAFSRLDFWGTSERAAIYTKNDETRLYLSAVGGTYLPDGPLWVNNIVNNDNYCAVINTNGGASAKSSIYVRANSTADLRIYQNSPLNTSGIGANNADMYNGAGRMHLQSIGTTNTGIIIAQDGKTIGINKLPSAGNALDINGGDVIINQGYLGVNRVIDADNYIGISNSNTGSSARSTLYLTCGGVGGRMYIKSSNNVGGIGSSNMELINSGGRLHLQSNFGTTAGIIIAQDGKTVGINKLPTAGQALDIDGALTVSGYSTLTGNSATYTPVFSDPGGDISVAAPTNVSFNWIRIGNIVQCAGIVTLSTGAGAGNAVSFEFTLPYNHTNTGNSVQGVANVQIGTTILSGEVLQGTAANRALCRVRAQTGASIGAVASFGVRMVFNFNA